MVDNTLATLALYPNSGRAANSANGNASLAPQFPREFASWSASGARKPMLALEFVVPEEGLEPTRAVKPTGF